MVYKFTQFTSAKSDFESYRPPLEKSFAEDGSSFISCYKATCDGDIPIYNIPQQIFPITQAIASQLDNKYLPVILRFGIPALTAHVEGTDNDEIKIQTFKPLSFVIDKNRNIISEQKWVVIGDHEDWTFPDNLSVAEADWAGWLSRSQNTMFMQEINWHTIGEEPFIYQMEREFRRNYLRQSLFIAGSFAECDALTENLSDEDHPDWYCDYGPNGILMGWFHPALEAIENGQMSFHTDPHDEKYKGELTVEINEGDFQNLVQRVRHQTQGGTFSEIDFEQAKLISAAANDDLLPDRTTEEARSADLFLNFEYLPSPVYMGKRKFIFVRMWQIPSSPSEARSLIDDKKITLKNQQAKIYWDARRGYKTNSTFVRSSLSFEVPLEQSADEYFEDIKPIRQECLDELANHIQSLWRDAKLATEFFWREEVGFKIDDKGFRGTPWVKFFKQNSTKSE